MGQGGKLDAKAAAKRLVDLKGERESDAEFARRLNMTSQHVHNYREGTGLSLDVLARASPRLSDEELIYVLTGRDLASETSVAAAFGGGLSVAADRLEELVAALRERAKEPRLSPTERERVETVIRAARGKGRGRKPG